MGPDRLATVAKIALDVKNRPRKTEDHKKDCNWHKQKMIRTRIMVQVALVSHVLFSLDYVFTV